MKIIYSHCTKKVAGSAHFDIFCCINLIAMASFASGISAGGSNLIEGTIPASECIDEHGAMGGEVEDADEEEEEEEEEEEGPKPPVMSKLIDCQLFAAVLLLNVNSPSSSLSTEKSMKLIVNYYVRKESNRSLLELQK